ncbi:unnamed protein product [Moneuplotes crassus]|uniref:C2H2-type domain-containing protein n=1 Tax=Euplotes crassus TaxID=5936 RepID=A0AAD1XMK9_EUPCR|nr:unnamed protein product [Moneuplotes crassus]
MLHEIEEPRNSLIFPGVKLPVIFESRDKNIIINLCAPLKYNQEVFMDEKCCRPIIGIKNDKVLKDLQLENNSENVSNNGANTNCLFSEHQRICSDRILSESLKSHIMFHQSSHLSQRSFGIELKSENSGSTDSSRSSPRIDFISKGSRSEEISVLKDYQYSVTYIKPRGSKRSKRVINCRYDNCQKFFYKTWNFIDHARMHLGVKPFVCNLCRSCFTQKGNLKTHYKSCIQKYS